MISKNSYKFNNQAVQTECVGLSTDTKPNNLTNGAIFYEMDTKKTYMYDEENHRWLEQ